MPARLFPPNIPLTKRVFDLFLTVPGVIILSPILLVVAVLVRIFHGKPTFFKHERPGYLGEPFFLYKFRTMTDARNSDGSYQPDENRITPLGKFLRATSLDELPELYNVLRGEMSLVGPRPLLMQYLDRYTPEQSRRHNVVPGITGWAQVNGRNNLSWEYKFELDVWYVDNLSTCLDFRILLLTLWKVIRREGINEPGNATAREFMGTHPKSQS